MAVAKANHAYGYAPGHAKQYSDAVMAYPQSYLGGDPCYVRLPKEWWPESWHKIRDPVVRLWRSLYGHPDAGAYWEQHCTAMVKQEGFEPIANWPSCFFHPQKRLFLCVYVDDFSLAGPIENLAWG